MEKCEFAEIALIGWRGWGEGEEDKLLSLLSARRGQLRKYFIMRNYMESILKKFFRTNNYFFLIW